MTALPSPAPLPVDAGARRRAAVELSLLQVVYVLFLLPWLGVVAFLAGGITGSGPVLAVLALLAVLGWGVFPFVVLGTAVNAWVLFRGGRVPAARRLNRVPLFWVVVGSVLLVGLVLAG